MERVEKGQIISMKLASGILAIKEVAFSHANRSCLAFPERWNTVDNDSARSYVETDTQLLFLTVTSSSPSSHWSSAYANNPFPLRRNLSAPISSCARVFIDKRKSRSKINYAVLMLLLCCKSMSSWL